MTILLGFDFGMKHIGVAIGQTITQTASPLTTLAAVDGVPNFEEIQKLLTSWKPDIIVVGIPLNMDGTVQPITFCARGFVRRLAAQTQLPIVEVDERLSTFEARQRIKENKESGTKHKSVDINALSAAILIEQWMNENQNSH